MNEGRIEPPTGVRKLIVYERSIELVESVYRLTRELPSSEQFGLTSQLRRAATSIPLNIAEGFGRQHRRDYAQLLAIARGSAYEVDTALEVSVRIDLLRPDDTAVAHGLCIEVIKMLTTMLRRMNDHGPA